LGAAGEAGTAFRTARLETRAEPPSRAARELERITGGISPTFTAFFMAVPLSTVKNNCDTLLRDCEFGFAR